MDIQELRDKIYHELVETGKQYYREEWETASRSRAADKDEWLASVLREYKDSFEELKALHDADEPIGEYIRWMSNHGWNAPGCMGTILKVCVDVVPTYELNAAPMRYDT